MMHVVDALRRLSHDIVDCMVSTGTHTTTVKAAADKLACPWQLWMRLEQNSDVCRLTMSD